MEQATPAAKRIHPLIATAAVSLIMVSLAGVAAITGLLPSSHGTGAPPAPPLALASTPPTATEAPAPATSAPVAPPPAARQAVAAPAPHHASPTHAPHAAAPKPRVAPREPVRAEPVQQAAVCHSCGRVESVSVIQHEPPQTSGVGVAAGAVIGGLLGHQIGGGNGRTLATVAGAVGGSLAGNEVERRTRAAPPSYQVRVRMEDGSVRSFPYPAAPGWNAGDRVQVINGQLAAQS